MDKVFQSGRTFHQLLLLSLLLTNLNATLLATNTSAPKLLPDFVASLEDTANYKTHIYVSKNAAPNGDGSKDKPYNDLKQALQLAKPGTYYHIAAGR